MIALLTGLALTAAADTSLERTLRARDQDLLNAIASGNRALWDAALTPDAVYVDENGTIFTRGRP
jgi:hypothetical protein